MAIAHNLQNWDLWYSTTGPNGPWITIVMDLPPGSPAPGSIHIYEWTVPNTPTKEGRVRVRMDNSGQDYYDISDGDFIIEGGVACGKVKCRRGKLKATVLSDLPRNTVLHLTRDGVDTKEVTVDRVAWVFNPWYSPVRNRCHKAKTKWKNQSGRHEVCLDECPEVCGKADCR